MTAYASSLKPNAIAFTRLEAVIWPLAIAIGLIPVWAFTYYPTVDGPAHLALTQALVLYDDPSFPAFQEFFALRDRLFPNLLMHVFLGGLMQLFNPLTAEKLLISAYLVSFPLALRYAAGAFGRQAGFIGLLGVPLSHHALLAFGFYNSSFAIIFFLLTFGFWLRHAESGGARALAGYVVLGLLCFFCHVSAVLMTVGAIAATTLSRTAAELLRREQKPDIREILRRFTNRALIPALGFLPALGLALHFLLSGRRGSTTLQQIAEVSAPAGERLLRLFLGNVLVQHDKLEMIASVVFIAGVVGLVVLIWFCRDGRKPESGLLGFVIVVFGVYLIAPFHFHVRWIPLRLEPYVLLAIILWLASRVPAGAEHSRLSMRRITIGLVCAVMVFATGVRFQRIAQIDAYLRELVSLAAEIEAGSTLLALPLGRTLEGRPVSDRHFVMIQAGSFVAVSAGAIDLKNYQIHTSVVPIVFRPAVRPWTHLASDEEFRTRPLEVDVTAYREATGHAVDYVILFGEPEQFPGHASQHTLTRALADDYELVRHSEPLGFARLYRFTGD